MVEFIHNMVLLQLNNLTPLSSFFLESIILNGYIRAYYTIIWLLIFDDIKFQGLSYFSFQQKKLWKKFQGFEDLLAWVWQCQNFLRLLYLKLTSCRWSKDFLQHLQDLYTVIVISDLFKLLVWTWTDVDRLCLTLIIIIHYKSVALSPLIIRRSYSGSVSGKISKSESFNP